MSYCFIPPCTYCICIHYYEFGLIYCLLILYDKSKKFSCCMNLWQWIKYHIISYHTVYITLYFCVKNPTACTLRVTPTTLMLPVHLSFCVQTDAMSGGWVLNIPASRMTIDDWRWGRELCWKRDVDVEAAPFLGLIIAYDIMHYNYLLPVVSFGLCHYSASHSRFYYVKKLKYQLQTCKLTIQTV